MTRATFFCATLLLASCVTEEVSLSDTEQHAAAAFQNDTDPKRWPGVRPIYYYIDLDGHHPDKRQRGCDESIDKSLIPDVQETIESALEDLQSQTPIRFEALGHPPTEADHKFVLIFTQGSYGSPHGDDAPGLEGENGWSPDDYQGCVYLGDGTGVVGATEHEIGHVLGLIHEHSRPDRDTYVDVDYTCLKEGSLGNFEIVESTPLAPYDYQSLMHYRPDAQCDLERPECVGTDGKCKRFSILRVGCTNHIADAHYLNCTDVDGQEIGTGSDLSVHDINTLYRMYEPSLGIDETNDEFGAAMASGDFDGDGYDDLAVGAPGEAPDGDPASGSVILYKGTEAGLVAWTYLSVSDFDGGNPVAGDRFGAALAAGDFNSDGADELFVGAPNYNGGAGAVFRYHGANEPGKRHGPTANTIYSDPSPSSGANHFGTSIAVGKLDGTTMAIVAGAPNAARTTTRSGLVFVHTKGTAETDWTMVYPDNGRTFYPTGTQFGASVAIGNLTAVHSGGFAVGAPASAFVGPGRVFVYTGALALVGIPVGAPSSTGDRFGAAVDVGHFLMTSTGKDYLVVGAPSAGTGGKVTMWSSSSNPPSSVTLMQTLTAADVGLTPKVGDQFGASLAHGNVDTTSYADDLVVGIPGNNNNQGGIGLFRFSGLTSLVGWTSRTEKDDGFPRQAGDRFGASVAVGTFGDVLHDLSSANDTIADVAAGAPGRRPNNIVGAGAFQWFFGQHAAEPVFAAGLDQAAASPE